MTNRRGFLASLLALPVIGRLWPRKPFTWLNGAMTAPVDFGVPSGASARQLGAQDWSCFVQPETWEGPVFETPNGEPIVDIIPAGDGLLIFTKSATYKWPPDRA